MKRAKQLQPLSREHHLGLHISRHAKDCEAHPDQINEHWSALTTYINHDMAHHFDLEDNILAAALLPLKASHPDVAAVLSNLEAQHREIDELTQLVEGARPSQEQVIELANALYDHIRFEERELLPVAEQYLTQETLDAIYAASPDNVKRIDEGR